MVFLSLLPLHAENKNREAATLIERAKQLSDIRSEASQPFKLEAKFTNFAKDPPEEGTYTEIWVSRGQWRRETVIGGVSHAAVANGRKLWGRDDDLQGMQNSSEVQAFASLSFLEPRSFEPDKIQDQSTGSAARCVISMPNAQGAKSALCFDPNTGLLLQHLEPEEGGKKNRYRVCSFGKYQMFGDKVFPGSVRCFMGRTPTLQIDFVVTAQPPVDATTFSPPPGTRQFVNCLENILPPQPVKTPDPDYPEGIHGRPTKTVTLWVVVGTDGRPNQVRVAGPGDKPFDDNAVKTVQQWSFKPATCGSEAVEVRIQVNIIFRRW
jgi:TonB family protein